MSAGDMSSDEVTITVEVVRRLVAGQFPEWAELPVVPVPSPGVDNATYRLGDTMSVRLPRFARWEGQVAREQRWLPWLGPRLPLPVPVPLAQGKATEEYPFPWSIYRWLDGRRPDPGRLSDLGATATELAKFFLALQAVDATGGPPPEWSNGFRGVGLGDERDSAVVEGRVRPWLAALEGRIDTAAATAVFDAALAAPPWDRPPVWVHGDPAPGNLLARDGRLTAVIDFGTLAIGDPAVDLIAAWTLLDGPSRATFRAELAVDDATWARGRAWGLTALLPDPNRPATDANVKAARLDALLADLGR
ncbi:aminoglycoside phosphotransferase family protein [Amycolatopsis rhabdoformis]|uniref:Aminoglycoside phosphotransferase family protein n=1 Tax=Amycolatopsis rhabdoformis TaxID=1448059 RepID=A0ABZ1I6I1_9PSEU|nr:aminoglycoside phosphotransferase family protein [Amycolatopsis rhabdoformis]WSE29814.1 aminoglycoside phosphotransferase family protein [Amycolatopsis rhabdoformis]